MGFNLINMDTWNRKECFEHFYNNAKCTYSITVNIDITNLHIYIKENGLRLYPVFTWIVSKAINNHQEFKMSFDQEGRIGYFDEIGPNYSVLNDDTKIMSSLYTPFYSSFAEFYDGMVNEMESYKKDKNYVSKMQWNFFIVSCLPWFSYTSFDVNNQGEQQWLFPMVTWGKFFEQDNKILMPLTIQVHHAVADGYHCSLFFNDVQEISSKADKFLKL